MRLLVFDGNSIINRAFYGVRALTNSQGLFTNALYGFLSIFFKEVEEEQPDAVCVAFDLPAPTFRHLRYAGYKAQRKGMPEELAIQLPVLKELLQALRVCQLELAGYEADDIIGTLAARCDAEEDDCVIVTGDKDDLQLVSDYVTVKLATTKGGTSQTLRYDPDRMRQTYGFEPRAIVDLKALMGDPSDNIPGVPGVGEKTALTLLRQVPSLEELYRDLSALGLRDSLRRKLEEGRESALLSYELALIDRAVPLVADRQSLLVQPPDEGAVTALFRRLEFHSLLGRFQQHQAFAGGRPAAEPSPVPTEDESECVQDTADPASLSLLLGQTETLFLSLPQDGEEEGLYLATEHSPVCHRVPPGPLTEQVLCCPLPKVVQEAKTAMTLLGNLGQTLRGLAFDPALAAYLLNPSAKTSLAALTAAHLDRDLTDTPIARLTALRQLTPLLRDRLKADGMDSLMRDLELPLSEVLSEMERLGFLVDREALSAFGARLVAETEGVEREIHDFVGPFKINSPKQLGEVLFERLGLPHGRKTKTGYSTDADTLARLAQSPDAHPILPLILRYRKLTKLNSTYVEGLLALADANGRVHSTFHQTVTLTGRLSSSEPNLQNIPVREELGRELRRMFVAAPGHVLIDADYSQIELRVLAHMADDANMIAAFCSGADIHTITAAQVFGVDPDRVTPDMRRSAKAVNFGIVYGISDFSLAADIQTTRASARRYIDSYFATYPGIRRYLDDVVAAARRDGYVTTLLGRRRYLPELTSSNFNQRSFGERAAMNTPIQGTAADIIKLAMVRVYRRLLTEGLQARLILQVHDELLVEAPLHEVHRAAALVKEEMERAMLLRAPLKVDLNTGATWYDAH